MTETLVRPDRFFRKPPAGFDGVFNWEWTQGCFGSPKMTPMDFDGVFERYGQFLCFETKDVGVPIPPGQVITLKALIQTVGPGKHGRVRWPCWTVLEVWGKTIPERAVMRYPMDSFRIELVGVESIRAAVAKWYRWADAGGYTKP